MYEISMEELKQLLKNGRIAKQYALDHKEVTMDTTLQSIIEIALQQGIWAALYIYLFFRMLKENAERETQYQQMINHLSTNVVEGIADINDKLDDMARRLDNQST